MSTTAATPAPSSRRLLVLAGAVLIAAAGIGGFFLFRPAPPALPAIDLTAADPEVAEAIGRAMDAVRDKPRDGASWGHLGMILRAHDFDIASVEAFRAAEQFDPDNPKWPYLGGLTLVLFEADAGLALLQRAAEKSDVATAEPRLRLAEVLLDRGRVEEAEAAAAPVAHSWPNDPRAGLVLARVAAERGDWQQVLERTERFLSHPTIRRRATILRADALRRLDRGEEADAASRYATELPPDREWDDRFVQEVMKLQVGSAADLRDGGILLEAGQISEAIARLERAAAKARNPLPARLALARAFNASGDPALASQVARQAIEADPDSVEGWFQLGLAHYLLHDPKAIESLQRVITLKTDHALAYHFLGLARKEHGDRKGAEEAFEAALRSRPNYEPSRKALEELRGGK